MCLLYRVKLDAVSDLKWNDSLWNDLCDLVNYRFADSLIYDKGKKMAHITIENRELLINGKVVKCITAKDENEKMDHKIFGHNLLISFVREAIQKAGFTLVSQAGWYFVQNESLNYAQKLNIFATAYKSLPEGGVIVFDGNEFGGLGSGGMGYRCFKRPTKPNEYWETAVLYKELQETPFYYAVY